MGVTMREIGEGHLVGHADVAPHLRRAGRRRADRRAPDDDRQRRRARRRARRAPRRLGGLDQPRGARRRARARRSAPPRRRASCGAAATTSSPRFRSATRAHATHSSRAASSRPRSSSPRTARRSGRARWCSTPRSVAPPICRRSKRGSACAPVGADAVEIDLADELRNPWGILHGGVVATLVDLAAEHASGGGYTTDVVLHFLAPNRVGPVRAIARVLGARADGKVLRVEVRDVGAQRTTALAIVTAAPPD